MGLDGEWRGSIRFDSKIKKDRRVRVWCGVGDGGRVQICDQWNSKSKFDKKRKDENER